MERETLQAYKQRSAALARKLESHEQRLKQLLLGKVEEVEWLCFAVSLTRVLLEPVLHVDTSIGDVKLRAHRFLSTFLSREGLPAVTGAKRYLAVPKGGGRPRR